MAGFEDGNTAALVHGATSTRTLESEAAALGARLADELAAEMGVAELPALKRLQVEAVARTSAALARIDLYLAHSAGIVDKRGRPKSVATLYLALMTQQRTAMAVLEGKRTVAQRQRGAAGGDLDGQAALAELQGQYGRGAD